MEDLEKRGKDLLLKKQVKLAKIDDKIKKELKEFRREMQEKDFNRSQKKKHVDENMNDLTRHSEEVYKEHLV